MLGFFLLRFGGRWKWKRVTNHHCCQQATRSLSLSLFGVSSSNEVYVGSSRTGSFGAPKANEPREERKKYVDLGTLRKECVHLVPIIKYLASGIKPTKPNPTKNCLFLYHHLLYCTFFDSSSLVFTPDKPPMFRNRYKTNNTERRLGLPTVNFQDMKSTRRGSDTEDTEDDTDLENEELSIDDAPTKKQKEEQTQNEQERKDKRKKTDEEIAKEYESKARKKKQRRKQPKLEPEQLNKGLLVLEKQFPTAFHDKTKFANNNKKKNPKSMAQFASSLIHKYRQWSDDMLPGVPLEEVLWKLHTMNGKHSVKPFLETMRQQVRNQHVEKLYGIEGGEALIAKLEGMMTLMMQEEEEEEEENERQREGLLEEEEDDDGYGPRDQESLESQPQSSSPPTTTATTATSSNVSREQETSKINGEPSRLITPRSKKRNVLEDSSDEEELQFGNDDDDDDDEEEETKDTVVKQPVSRPNKRQRMVLEDSEDEDEGIFVENNQEEEEEDKASTSAEEEEGKNDDNPKENKESEIDNDDEQALLETQPVDTIADSEETLEDESERLETQAPTAKAEEEASKETTTIASVESEDEDKDGNDENLQLETQQE